MTPTRDELMKLAKEFPMPEIGAIHSSFDTGMVEQRPAEFRAGLITYGRSAVMRFAKNLSDLLSAHQAQAHASDCAVHNMPAMPSVECDCGARQAQAEPAHAEAECPRCKGSGDQEYLVGGGPDPHDEIGPCSGCGGTGAVIRVLPPSVPLPGHPQAAQDKGGDK